MIMMSHPTCNANVRQAALALEVHDLLAELWTCISTNPDAWIMRQLPSSLVAEIRRRALPASVRPKVHTRPAREIGRLVIGKVGLGVLTKHESGFFSVDAIYRTLDLRVSRQTEQRRGHLLGVYAYEDGALETFRVAERRCLKRFYDLPIGYWREWRGIGLEEREREPEWAGTLQGISDSAEKFARKEEELRLANAIVVASTYTRKTLLKASNINGEVHVIPYGSPTVGAPRDKRLRSGALRVLFIGALSQRKGLSYMLKAVSEVKHAVELTLIGTKGTGRCKPLERALRQHRWIASLPHDAVLNEMRAHDVFVFPSLFEGFGLVILEAMSQGLPVITTANTGGPDIIEDGREGFIVPIRCAGAIAEKLDLLAGNRQLLAEMQEAARRRVATITWEKYRDRLFVLVREALGGPSYQSAMF